MNRTRTHVRKIIAIQRPGRTDTAPSALIMGLSAQLRPKRLLVLSALIVLGFLLLAHRGAELELTTDGVADAAPRFKTVWNQAVAGANRIAGKRPSNIRTGRGLVEVYPGSEHPIYGLIEDGKRTWKQLLSRQSQSLSAAVAEYRRRYAMDPPAGFDDWYKFCRMNGVKIIDDYDGLHSDILPFHALSPATYRARQRKFTDNVKHSYNMTITQTSLEADGDRADATRPGWMQNFISGFQAYLPADFKVEVFASDHDIGQIILGRDQWDRTMEAIEKGEFIEEDELKEYEDPKRTEVEGWFSACRPGDPALSEDWKNLTRTRKAFVYDHAPVMDFCKTPTLKSLIGVLSYDRRGRSPSELRPMLVLSKMPMDSEFRITPLDAYSNYSITDLGKQFYAWEDKSDRRIFWRGLGTGGFNTQIDWRLSQRMRLHLMMNGKKDAEGQEAFWEGEEEVMVVTPDGWQLERRKHAELAKAYADVSLVDKPHQCEGTKLCGIIAEEINFGPRVQPKEAMKYKYVVDVDGNGWSSRFHRLLASGSVVYKMTNTPEWNQEWLVPWYHYIPVQPDFSDLFDIQSFFAGPLDGSGEIDTARGHDDLARAIGEAGQQFTREHWRWEDMQAYVFRLLLEIQRLAADDRSAASYRD